MPRIPTQDEPGVAPTPLPTPFITPATVAAAQRPGRIATQALSDATSEVAAISLQLQRKASATIRARGTNDLRQAEQDLEFGNQELGIEGFRNSQGENALEAERIANEDLKKRRDEIAGGIKKTSIRDQFMLETEGRTIDFQRRAATHSMGEQDKVALMEWKADQAGFTQDALQHLRDFGDAQSEQAQDAALGDFMHVLGRYVDQATTRADELGYPDSFRDSEIDRVKSTVLRAGVESLIDQGHAGVAEELYDAMKDPHIQSSDQGRIDEVIGPANDLEKGRAKVKEMFEGVEDLTADFFTKVTDTINDEEDAGQQDVMRAEATRRFAQLKEAKFIRDEATVNTLWDEQTANPEPAKLPTDTRFQSLDKDDKDVIERRAKMVAAGKPWAANTDWEHVTGFWDVEFIRDENGEIIGQRDRTPQEKAKLNILKLQPYMEEDHWRGIRAESNSLDSASSRGPSALGGVHTRLKEMLNQAGEDTIEALKEDPATMGRLNARVRAEVDAITHDPDRKGRPLSAPETNELLSKILHATITDEGTKFDTVSETNFFNSEVPVFLAKFTDVPDEEHMTFEGDIPAQQHRLVRDALRFRHEREPTEAEVRKGFAQAAMGNDDEISQFLENQLSNENETEPGLDIDSQLLDPSIADEVRLFTKEADRDPNNPADVLKTWQEMQAMFGQSSQLLRVGVHTDEQLLESAKRMQIAKAFYGELVKGGMSDVDARTHLGLQQQLSEFRTELKPASEGTDAP